jgi:hypothetical protein
MDQQLENAEDTTLCIRVGEERPRDPLPTAMPRYGRLLFGALVAGPDEVLFGRERLLVLVDLKLPFGHMAEHGIVHRVTRDLRSRLYDNVTHRDSLETGNEGRCLTTVSTHHDTWPRRAMRRDDQPCALPDRAFRSVFRQELEYGGGARGCLRRQVNSHPFRRVVKVRCWPLFGPAVVP